MIKKFKRLSLLLVSIILLSACSASFKEEQIKANAAVKEAFYSSPKTTNKENKEIEYYLPFGYEVEEETSNNVLLKNGSKSYILFYNQHEDLASKVVYEATIAQKEYDVNETFEEEDKMGFLLINQVDENLNELIVGIGGVKLTSQSKTKNIASDAAVMMEIAHSVKLR